MASIRDPSHRAESASGGPPHAPAAAPPADQAAAPQQRPGLGAQQTSHPLPAIPASSAAGHPYAVPASVPAAGRGTLISVNGSQVAVAPPLAAASAIVQGGLTNSSAVNTARTAPGVGAA